MNDIERLAIRDRNRYRILKHFYDLSVSNPPNAFFDLNSVKESLLETGEISSEDFDSGYHYLKQKRLLEAMTLLHSVITQYGIEEIESSIKNPEQSTSHFPSESIQLVVNVAGDQITNNSSVSSNTGNVSIGKFNDVVNTVNENFQEDLVQALTALKEAVLNSQDLPDDQKQENVDVINSLSEECTKPKPNTTLMKASWKFLTENLKSVPAILNSITAISRFFSTHSSKS
jgi:hypothetical protein